MKNERHFDRAACCAYNRQIYRSIVRVSRIIRRNSLRFRVIIQRGSAITRPEKMQEYKDKIIRVHTIFQSEQLKEDYISQNIRRKREQCEKVYSNETKFAFRRDHEKGLSKAGSTRVLVHDANKIPWGARFTSLQHPTIRRTESTEVVSLWLSSARTGSTDREWN